MYSHGHGERNLNSKIVDVVLDIDISRNEPNIQSQKFENNAENWHGTEISLTIGGNWSPYRSKVLQYFQQLAVSFMLNCLVN